MPSSFGNAGFGPTGRGALTVMLTRTSELSVSIVVDVPYARDGVPDDGVGPRPGVASLLAADVVGSADQDAVV